MSNPLDDLMGKNLIIDGIPMPDRKVFSIYAGSGVALTATDDEVNGRTVLRVAASGSPYSAGFSTSANTLTMPTNDTAAVLPVGPVYSTETYMASDDWEVNGMGFRCLRAGKWSLSISTALVKTTAAQGAMLMIGLTSLVGTSILQVANPLLFTNIQTYSLHCTVLREMELALNDTVALLIQRDGAASGTVGTRGPIVFRATPSS